MANSPNKPRVTDRMRCCMINCKAENRLIRKPGGRWYGEHQKSVFPRYSDATVHALIVRGLLAVCDRQQVSRFPLAVKIAEEPV